MRTNVRDVMTADVVAVREDTSFKKAAELLVNHEVNALPVVDEEDRVLGVVSATDLAHKAEFKALGYADDYTPPMRARLRRFLAAQQDAGERKATGVRVADVMTAPPVTVAPESSIIIAARLMERHGVHRLPVVDSVGKLTGIVTRRDLLRVFTRSDEELKRIIRADLGRYTGWLDPGKIQTAVDDGVVTLAGHIERRNDCAILVRVIGRIDGVVDVHDELSWRIDDAPPREVQAGW